MIRVEEPRATIRIYLSGVLFCVAGLAPILAIYAPLGIAPLCAAGAVATLAIAAWCKRRILLVSPLLIGFMAALLAWAALSSLWAINPSGAVKTIFQLLGWCATLVVLAGSAEFIDEAGYRWLVRSLAAGMALALTVYGVEILFHSPIQSMIRNVGEAPEVLYSTFNRGLSVLVLLIVPTIVGLRRSSYPGLAVVLFLIGAVIVYAYYGSSMQVALTCGILVAAFVFWRGRLAMAVVGASIAAVILMAPLLAKVIPTITVVEAVSKKSSNISLTHRLVIWHFTATKIFERPLLGWGLDSARIIPGGKETVLLQSPGCTEPCGTKGELMPLHPHNMALQWWLELGLPGALIMSGFIFTLFVRIPQLSGDRIEQALLSGQIASTVAIGCLSYGTWQSWWLASIILAFVLSRIMVGRTP